MAFFYLNRSASQTLIVGDSILDFQMGKAVGGFTCGAAFGAHSANKLAAAGADWIIGEFGELPDLLQIPRIDRNERLKAMILTAPWHLRKGMQGPRRP